MKGVAHVPGGADLKEGAGVVEGSTARVRKGLQSEVHLDEKAWDELSDSERVAHLQSEFSEAIAEIEVGAGSPDVVARAQGALSELRAQMYSTEEGRTKHLTFEERLTRLTEETNGGDGEEAN